MTIIFYILAVFQILLAIGLMLTMRHSGQTAGYGFITATYTVMSLATAVALIIAAPIF